MPCLGGKAPHGVLIFSFRDPNSRTNKEFAMKFGTVGMAAAIALATSLGAVSAPAKDLSAV